MKYGQIANNKEFSDAIYRRFEHLCDDDQRRFVNKFSEQRRDFEQTMHTFGELILGAYLSSRGFEVRYEYRVENKTPDWCVLDKKSAVIGIIDLVNFHRDKDTENEIDQGHAVWSRENKNNYRLYDCIWEKMQKYRALIEELGVPYIIAICPDWRAGIDFQRLLPCLHHNESGLFQMYQYVSGVLYFEGNLEQYSFRYEHNPYALRKVDLSNGVFSLVPEQASQQLSRQTEGTLKESLRGAKPLLKNHSPLSFKGEGDTGCKPGRMVTK